MIWLPSDRAKELAQGQADQQQQQQQQQGGVHDPAAQQMQQDQQAEEQQVQLQQQDAAADPAAAAPMSETASPVPQRWHIQLLVESAQNPVLTKPAIKACAIISQSSGTYALLLAPYRLALVRVARRLRRLVGVNWGALNHRGFLSDQQIASLTELDQPAVDQVREYVDLVWQTVEQVTAMVNKQLAEEKWEQQVAAVQFALLWRGSGSQQRGADGIGGKRPRMCGDDSTTAAAAAAAVAAADVMEVMHEEEGQAAAGGCGVMEQQQQQLMAALCAMVMRSKRRIDLQEMVRAARRQL
jgi:hypothetical protein